MSVNLPLKKAILARFSTPEDSPGHVVLEEPFIPEDSPGHVVLADPTTST